jgi:hypothetical protein
VRLGANVDAIDGNKRTPPHYATWKGFTETMGQLIRLGANVDK